MPSHLRSIAALLVIAPLGGCCALSQSLSALFCGPSEAPWSVRDFDTPDAALQTFLGAVSRDDVETIYLTLGYTFKKTAGIGELEFRAAWQDIKAKTPGIHLAHRAAVSEPRRAAADRVVYTLTMNTIPSAVLEVALARQDYWSVTVRPEGSSERQTTGEVVPGLETYFKVLPHEERSPVRVDLPGPEFPGLSGAEFEKMVLGREWKIAGLRVVADQN